MGVFTRGSPRAVVTRSTSSGPHTLPRPLLLTLTCTDWPAYVVAPLPPQQRPGRRFGPHRRRGKPTSSNGPRITRWTTLHGASSRSGMRPPGFEFLLRRLCRLHVYIGDSILGATPPCSTAVATPMPPASRHRTHHRNRKAVVRRLDYVHALRHGPSSLFRGPGNAPAFPVSC